MHGASLQYCESRFIASSLLSPLVFITSLGVMLHSKNLGAFEYGDIDRKFLENAITRKALDNVNKQT